METRVLPTDPAEALKAAVDEAVAILRRGDLVALPTETVYGLAGDAFSESAVARIFEAKDRPSYDPLIVHLPHKEMLEEVAEIPETLSKTVARLTERFWPGPLTLVVKKRDVISDAITAGQPTVAVRLSGNPVFRHVIRAFGGPLAAPSANRFGRISPTSASAVVEELGGRIPLVLDGGACSSGLESTIVMVSEGTAKPEIRILRAGPVTREDLKPFGKVVRPKPVPEAPGLLTAPGQTDSHYAPRTRFTLLTDPARFEAVAGRTYALLSFRGDPRDGYLGLTDFQEVAVLSPGSGKLPEAAVRLFHLMRKLDHAGVDEILAEPVPERGIGVAIMDRLRRASH